MEQATSLRLFYALRGPIAPPKDIAIIALNSASAEQLGYSHYSGNWPRSIHAQLINKLKQANARLVVMDIAFKEAHAEEEDALLEQALINNHNVILFKYLKRHQISSGVGTLDIEQEIPPLLRFEQHALASGSFTLPKYPAQVYNSHLFHELSNGIEATQPILAYLALQTLDDQLAIWRQINPRAEMPKAIAERARQLFIQEQQVNLTQLSKQQQQIAKVLSHKEPLTINFYGYPKTLITWPIDRSLSLNQEQFKQAFSKKIVYIGFSDSVQTEQQDAYRTAFSNRLGVDLSGVEISATVFSNLLEQTHIRTPSPLVLLMMATAALALGFLGYTLPRYWNIAVQGTCASILLGVGHLLFSHFHIWLPLLTPIISLTVANGFMLAQRFNMNKQRTQYIRFALSQYLPDKAANKLSHNVSTLEKQHQLVHGVCLMTDIQGYTSLSETLAPDVLHELMNAYYAELLESVEQYGGFIGNLVGDGMLALWTGPEVTPEMCQSALLAAKEIQQRVNRNPRFSHSLPTCSAIHGGQFSLGNLGAKGHFEYSPVGDIINTASRVEHFNRNLGTQFLCTEPIAKQLAINNTNLRALGSFTFRHKSIAMPLYGLIDKQPQALLSKFTKALDAYEKEKFEAAKMLFEQLVTGYRDGPSRYYVTEIVEKLK